jgi:hypothetical protein
VFSGGGGVNEGGGALDRAVDDAVGHTVDHASDSFGELDDDADLPDSQSDDDDDDALPDSQSDDDGDDGHDQYHDFVDMDGKCDDQNAHKVIVRVLLWLLCFPRDVQHLGVASYLPEACELRISVADAVCVPFICTTLAAQIGEVEIKQYHGAEIKQHGAGIRVRPTESTGRAADAAFAAAIVRMCHAGTYKY